MTANPDAHRRRLLGAAAGAVAAASTASALSACGEPAANDRRLRFGSLDEALDELARLGDAQALAPATAWNWAQTLNHCAQSIEFSMTGFPQPKSRLFQRTVGLSAFKVFAWRGRMSHDLGDPIPGAPGLDAGAELASARARLTEAVRAFGQWEQPLQAHFAYGELDQAEYALAHAMHLANHFSAFRARA